MAFGFLLYFADVMNYQLVAASCGRLGAFGLLGWWPLVSCCTLSLSWWMLFICLKKEKNSTLTICLWKWSIILSQNCSGTGKNKECVARPSLTRDRRLVSCYFIFSGNVLLLTHFSPNLNSMPKQGVCHTMALPFTLKTILRQKKN